MKCKVIYFNTFTGFPYFWKTAAFTELAKRQKEGLRIDDLKRATVAIYTSNSYSIVNSRLETVSLYDWDIIGANGPIRNDPISHLSLILLEN